MVEWTRLKPAVDVIIAIPAAPPLLSTGASADPGQSVVGLEILERAAAEILVAHDFPVGHDPDRDVLWDWTGRALLWTARPSALAAMTKARGAQRVLWAEFKAFPEYRWNWPPQSSFDWAEHVWRFRQARARALAQGDMAEAWAAGIGLGSYLGYHHGGQARLVDKAPLAATAATWKGYALHLARELRALDPSLGHIRLARALIKDARLRHRLEAAKCALPSRDQLVGVIRGWEQEWRSNPKTGLAPSTRNPNLRR